MIKNKLLNKFGMNNVFFEGPTNEHVKFEVRWSLFKRD